MLFRLAALSFVLLSGCGTTCEVDAPIDYSSDSNWICKPGVAGACPTEQKVVVVQPDGTQTDELRTYTSATGVACFVVYPTVDHRVGSGIHHDTSDINGPRNWARHLAAPMGTACDLYVPVYRQVIIGTYVGNDTKKKSLCFDNAYADVENAFQAFLAAEPDRPFALLGHSQGSQHLSRLMREHIETDGALQARLVSAYLLGWDLGTDSGGVTGGSFERIPLCTDANTPGCVIAYGSFLDGKALPPRGRFEEGSLRACVNPAAPGSSGPMPLAALTIASTTFQASADSKVLGEQGVLAEYPGAFSAECVGEEDAALLLTTLRDDLKLNEASLGGQLGAHPIDVDIALTELQADLRRRAELWSAR